MIGTDTAPVDVATSNVTYLARYPGQRDPFRVLAAGSAAPGAS